MTRPLSTLLIDDVGIWTALMRASLVVLTVSMLFTAPVYADHTLAEKIRENPTCQQFNDGCSICKSARALRHAQVRRSPASKPGGFAPSTPRKLASQKEGQRPWNPLSDRQPAESTIEMLTFGKPYLLEWRNVGASRALAGREKASAFLA